MSRAQHADKRSRAGSQVRHIIAAQRLAAAGRMIVAYRRSDSTATNYEIGEMTVALQHLKVGNDASAR